jgi:hypothetical protein
MASRKVKPRTEHRRLAAQAKKLAHLRLRAFQLEEGGSPERPISLTSASLVETHARSVPCPICGSEQRLQEHTALTLGSTRLRQAKMVCVGCRSHVSVWFRLAGEWLH